VKKLFIEIADSPIKRECGLMKRKHLPKNGGMLFKFHYPTFASFWMKDTYIPLDIAFLDGNGKILQIESMVPLSTRAVYSNHQCRYALEVNKGWFKENDIKVGSKVGGEGIKRNERTAQAQVPPPPLSPPALPPMEVPQPPQQPDPDPDVMLNLGYKERLKNASLKGQNLIIIYQTKGGFTLPPKVISPPFEFEKDEDGRHEAVVKAWDNQTGGWKSFLIDNILSLEEKK